MTTSRNTISLFSNPKHYIKNPLGIIALFISLIYAFACLLLGVSGKNIQDPEKLILIIFLVSFPIIVLFSFLYLVAKHYNKLFGPSDFKDEKNYLKTIDIMSQKSELRDQINSFKGQSDLPEKQNSLDDPISTFKDYLLVENLVLRIVERDYNLPQRKHIRFEGYKFTFDCVLEGNNDFIATKIKYILPEDEKYNQIVCRQLRRRYYEFQRIANEYYPNKSRKIIFYIVYKDHIESFKKEICSLFEKENNLEVEIKFFGFEYLIEKFLLD